MSHVLIEDSELGGVDANALNTATASDDIYAVLRVREGGLLGDRFLEDFALSLPDGSPEQAIILAVFDDRDCGNRAYCCKKLKIFGRNLRCDDEEASSPPPGLSARMACEEQGW